MRPCQGVSVAPCSARKPICRTRAVHPHPRTSSCSTKSHPVSICTGSCCKTSCCKSACPAPCRSACTAPCCRAQTWRSQACPNIVPCSPCSRDRSQSRSGCTGSRRASFRRAKPDGSQCIHLPWFYRPSSLPACPLPLRMVDGAKADLSSHRNFHHLSLTMLSLTHTG